MSETYGAMILGDSAFYFDRHALSRNYESIINGLPEQGLTFVGGKNNIPEEDIGRVLRGFSGIACSLNRGELFDVQKALEQVVAAPDASDLQPQPTSTAVDEVCGSYEPQPL